MPNLKTVYPQLNPYDVVPTTKVPGPTNGYRISTTKGNVDDSARYLQVPDSDFYRPWIATQPSGSAFVWPLGTQGFTFSSSATTGIHHYVGDNDVDIDVVYPDELHITLTGHFPGRTSTAFFHALRQVILEAGDSNQKLLSLPGVMEQIQYVKVINHSFQHDETDNTNSIAYSIEMVKVGIGGRVVIPKLQKPNVNPSGKTTPKGKTTKQKVTAQGGSGMRRIAAASYGTTDINDMYRLIQANANDLEANGILAYTLPFTPLGGGVTIRLA